MAPKGDAMSQDELTLTPEQRRRMGDILLTIIGKRIILQRGIDDGGLTIEELCEEGLRILGRHPRP